MPAAESIILGTRGSELARAQTRLAETALRAQLSQMQIEVRIIATRGDEKNGTRAAAVDQRAGRKGLFTNEIERALLDGEIDVAVHSAKDLPSDSTAGLEIVAALPRAPCEDVLVTRSAEGINSLSRGATIATGSVRRQHQLRWLRPDIVVHDLRGNVPTRLRKLAAAGWDGIILARAGLERLGHDLSGGQFLFEGETFCATVLSLDEFLPAGGQGIVALQTRADDEETREMVQTVNDAETMVCLRAEREFLRLLQGDCGTPVGVIAVRRGASLQLRAQLFENERAEPCNATVEGNPAEAESLAAALLESINGR